MSEKHNSRKKKKYPIEVRELKKGKSYRVRLPTELGRVRIKLGNEWEGFTYDDAVRAYQSIIGQIAQRKFKIKDTQPSADFKDFTQEYLNNLNTKKDDTSRERLYIKHLDDFFGHRALSTITPADIDSYIGRRLYHISSSTVRKEFYFLRKLFREASMPRWIPITNLSEDFVNPCVGLKPPSPNPPRAMIVNEAEIERLLDKSPNEVAKAIILFAIYSGCRQGEILPLQEKQVNWDKGFIYWPKTKNRKPKNLPLSPALEKILKEVPRFNDSPFFFCSPKLGKPYTKGGFASIFNRMRKWADLKELRFHDLRRVFGTKLAELGYTEKDIADLLGHEDTRSTRIYVKIVDKRRKEAMERVDFGTLLSAE